jgi:hypothetical protein
LQRLLSSKPNLRTRTSPGQATQLVTALDVVRHIDTVYDDLLMAGMD